MNTVWLSGDSIYHIGDTLFAESIFPKTLLNQDGRLINYSNSLGIGGNIFINELDSNAKEFINAVNNFTVIPLVGTSSAGNTCNSNFINIFYVETFDNFKLKIGFIIRKKGLFAFFLSDLASKGISGQNCTNASFSNTVNNQEQHINYFLFAMGRPPVSDFENQRFFCFRVL